jgi:hypothetical protein
MAISWLFNNLPLGTTDNLLPNTWQPHLFDIDNLCGPPLPPPISKQNLPGDY